LINKIKVDIVTNKHGDFIWYELLTKDADAAADFYGKVIGWTSTPSGQPGIDYRFFSSGDSSDMKDGVGGYMALTDDMIAGGAQPCWLGYIAVDDVDASVAAITASGGLLHMPAMDMDGVGRMAMVSDPQGATFYVMKGVSDETSHSFAAFEPKVGHCAWNELATTDPETAIDYYHTQFGWSAAGEMDMGDMGAYRFLKVSGDRFMLGAVYKKIEADPRSHWLFYFRVVNLDAAMAAVKELGGQIYMEPVPVPGDKDFSLIAYDPDGAAFGLIGPRV
jgi:uncharacterized protein